MAEVINFTFTSPVNRPGQQPILSQDDVWKGIEHITRRPQDVVDYVSRCEVFADTGLSLKRRLVFKEGPNLPDKPIEQNVEYVGPPGIGTSALVVAHGESDDEVYLSQTLQDPYPPGITRGSTEASEFRKHRETLAKSNIKSNIEYFRQLKANGLLSS
ncbi:hypothetical protein DHEL01_v212489 [Diaporthe helianthi]|uniref:Uncharacterized protein n=1 Tax=Diaporthe helianthi TaxID=158607 RepID=A0A2P5HFS9_DIAHE|nr:hypothetical protein DHEL01_v212489 [Diaporthe helianthi]